MDGLNARLSFDAVVYDYDDEYLTIDTDTHVININNVSRLFGVQYDGNSKLIKFRIRNKLSDIQKMQDSIVYINWIDSKGVKGQSIAINKTINNDTCEFAWKVPFDALKNSGVLHFAMSAVVTKNSSSVIDQRWSTQIASVITPDGIYIKSYTPSSEEEDRIAQIYNELSNMINKQNDKVNSLKEDLIDKTKNLKFWNIADISKAKPGYSYNIVVGKPLEHVENPNFTLFDEVYEVEAGKQYTVNWLYGSLGIYDNTDKIISANYIDSIPFTVTIPDGGVKMTLFGPSARMVNIMLVEGSKLPAEYIPHSIFDIETKKNSEQDKILESILHPLKGVKWCAFGDGLTSSSTLANMIDKKNYVDYVSNSLGLNVTNCGFSGTGYMKTENRFVNRVSTIPTDTEVLTVFGSFNDYEYIESNLGVFGDSGTDTIYGCMKSFFDSVFSRCPDIVVGVILPTKWGYLSPQKDSVASAKCDLYIKALTKTAEYYNLPILDLYSGSNLRPWDDVFAEKYYKDDDENGVANTVHPLDSAHKRFIAPKVETFIKRIYHVY